MTDYFLTLEFCLQDQCESIITVKQSLNSFIYNFTIFNPSVLFQRDFHCWQKKVFLFTWVFFRWRFFSPYTVWKVSKYRDFSRPYFPVFSPNTVKFGPEKVRIWALFMQWQIENLISTQLLEPAACQQES